MKIQLPHFVIADLYKNSLVIADTVLRQPLPEEENFVEPILHLGENAKNISILVNDKKNRFIDEQSLQLLVNMLTALQLTLRDVAVINLNITPFTYKQLIEQFGSRVCLMFDIPTQLIQLPFQMPDYKVQAFDNCTFLNSASLEKMKGNGKEAKVEKTKLWMCLKTIFE